MWREGTKTISTHQDIKFDMITEPSEVVEVPKDGDLVDNPPLTCTVENLEAEEPPWEEILEEEPPAIEPVATLDTDKVEELEADALDESSIGSGDNVVPPGLPPELPTVRGRPPGAKNKIYEKVERHLRSSGSLQLAVVEPNTYGEACLSLESEKWKEAMDKEMESFVEMQIERDWKKRKLKLHQLAYISRMLEENGMAECKAISTPANASKEQITDGMEDTQLSGSIEKGHSCSSGTSGTPSLFVCAQGWSCVRKLCVNGCVCANAFCTYIVN